MNIPNGIDTSKMINLDNFYVIIKRFNNTVYYYGLTGGRVYNSNSVNAQSAKLFTKEEADKKCEQLNTDRKKVKFRVDKASNHLVSNFRIEGGNWWSNTVSVKNVYASIQNVKQKIISPQLTVPTVDINAVIQNIQHSHLSNAEKILSTIDNDLSVRLAQITQEYALKKAQAQETITKYTEIKNFVETKVNDPEFLNQYKSSNDEKFNLLYGKGNTNGNS